MYGALRYAIHSIVTKHKHLETEQDRADLATAAAMVVEGKALRQRVLARIRARAFRNRKDVLQ